MLIPYLMLEKFSVERNKTETKWYSLHLLFHRPFRHTHWLKLWTLFQNLPILIPLMNCRIVVKLKKVSFWIPVWRLASSSTTTTVHNWSQSSFQRKQSQKYVKATTLATEVNHHSSEKNEAKADAICLLSETPLKEFRGYIFEQKCHVHYFA